MMPAQATFTSRLPEFQRDHRIAEDAALRVTATVLMLEIQRRMRGGYQSGLFAAFTGGRAAKSVVLSDTITEQGVRVIRVGSDWEGAREWELGWVEEFSGKYERVEHWKESALLLLNRLPGVFAAEYTRRMTQWAA